MIPRTIALLLFIARQDRVKGRTRDTATGHCLSMQYVPIFPSSAIALLILGLDLPASSLDRNVTMIARCLTRLQA